jgi:hypothetical protein
MLAVSVGNVLVPFAVVAATLLLEVAQFTLSQPLAAACLALALNCVPHVPAALATALAAVRSRKPKARSSVSKPLADETAPMQQRISSSGDLSTPGKAAGPGSVAKPPTPLPTNGGPKKTSPGPVKK